MLNMIIDTSTSQLVLFTSSLVANSQNWCEFSTGKKIYVWPECSGGKAKWGSVFYSNIRYTVTNKLPYLHSI